MNAKEYLSRAMWLDKMINNKLEYQETIRALAERTTVDMSQEKVSGGNNTTSPMENATVKLADLSKEIDQYIDKFVDLKREIQNTINEVEDMSYQLLLEMRYLNNKDWSSIVNEMMYDRSTIFRMHGRALNEVEAILKDATKCDLMRLPKGDII